MIRRVDVDPDLQRWVRRQTRESSRRAARAEHADRQERGSRARSRGGRRPRRARTTTTRVDSGDGPAPSPRARALAYADALGLDHADAHAAVVWTGRAREWRYRDYPITVRLLVDALAGRVPVDARAMRRTSCIVVDLDCHEVTPADAARELPGDDLATWLSRAARARASRTAIARRLRRAAAALRRVVPEVVVESSPRGLHAVVLLDRSIPVEDARALAVAIVERAGLAGRRDVEVFPAIDGGVGRLPRLPCTGPGRLLGRDLVQLRHRRRADDVRELLRASRVDVDELRGRLGVGDSATPPASLGRSLRSRDLQRVSVPEDFAEPCSSSSSPAEPHSQVRESTRDCPVDGASSGQLFGAAFSDEVVRLARRIPDDRSYDFARRFAAMMSYADIDDAEAVALFRRLIERPGHEATHCQTAAGRGQLVRTFRACLRRQRRGVERGEVHPGRLKNRGAWRMIEALRRDVEVEVAAEAKAVPRLWQETIAARRASAKKAAAARWSRPASEQVDPAAVVEAEIAATEAEVERWQSIPQLADLVLAPLVARLAVLEARRRTIEGRRLRR